jgi:hypothetical protein
MADRILTPGQRMVATVRAICHDCPTRRTGRGAVDALLEHGADTGHEWVFKTGPLPPGAPK